MSTIETTESPAGEPSRLFPHFFFRTTGFPTEMLDGLICPRSLELAERALELEQEVAAEVAAFKRHLSEFFRSGRKSRALNAVVKKIGKTRPISDQLLGRLEDEELEDWMPRAARYNRAIESLRDVEQRGEETLRGELEASREYLRTMASDPLFKEAVLLSSPGAYDGLERFARGAKVNRNTETKALLYLQRFCAKNDTISFFGPVTWGRFDPRQSASLEVSWNGEAGGRHVFYEHWAAECLAVSIEADPSLAAHLPWRVHYPFEWHQGTLYRHHPLAGRARRRIDPEEAALLARLADGGGVEAASPLERLREQQIVRAFVIGVEEMRPVERLLDMLREAVPAAARKVWEGRLRWLLEVRKRFEGADLEARSQMFVELERRFSEWTGDAARRKGGRTYAGRNLLYEDCTRDPQRFVFGGELHRELEADLTEVLGVQSALMEIVEPYGWRHLEEIYAKLSRGGRAVPLTKFLLKLSGGVGTGYLDHSLIRPEDEERLLDRAESVLEFEHLEEGRLAVSRRDPEAIDRAALLDRPVVLGFDVMVAARDSRAVESGDYRFVIGEIQYFPVGYPEYFGSFHPEPEAFAHDYRERVVEPRRGSHRLARLELEPEVTRLIRIDRPLADYLMVDSQGRSYGPDLPQRRITELSVELADGKILIRDKDGEVAELANPHHDLFLDTCWRLLMKLYDRRTAAARAAGDVEPELSIGRRTTLARRSWRLDASCLDPARMKRRDPWREAPFAAFVAMQRLRRSKKLPRRAFARTPDEIKPVLVDFDSPLTLENLTRMVPPETDWRLSEMSPAPGLLWHTTEAGHHTSEMRVFMA